MISRRASLLGNNRFPEEHRTIPELGTTQFARREAVAAAAETSVPSHASRVARFEPPTPSPMV
jgi:hypothetical protein